MVSRLPGGACAQGSPTCPPPPPAPRPPGSLTTSARSLCAGNLGWHGCLFGKCYWFNVIIYWLVACDSRPLQGSLAFPCHPPFHHKARKEIWRLKERVWPTMLTFQARGKLRGRVCWGALWGGRCLGTPLLSLLSPLQISRLPPVSESHDRNILSSQWVNTAQIYEYS